MIRVAINGFGRIGRNFLRCWLGRTDSGLEVVGINDTSDPRSNAHLLKYDSMLGKLNANIDADDNSLIVNGKTIKCYSDRNPLNLPWAEWGVDLVIEATGVFVDEEGASKHIVAGAKKVLITAPGKGAGVGTYVVGVNAHEYEHDKYNVISNASCTTNCLAPVVKVIHENLGIKHGQITTIHDPTNTNLVVDAPHKDLRRARSAMVSLAPTSTGSATAIALIYPELKGKLNGHAVRAPVLNASLTDCVFELQRSTTAEEVNALFEKAANGPLLGILGYETRPLVSVDYARDTRSSIIDALSTMVTDGTLLKVYAWYDNEMGYACRMVDLACYMESVGI